MANYSTIKDVIDANIDANGEGYITGPVLNGVLKGMIDALGEGYQFMGFAAHNSLPGNPDARVFYITLDAGTYSEFDGIEITKPSILYYDTFWHAQDFDGDFSTTLRVSDIVNTLDSDATDRPLSAAMGKELVLRLEALREAVQTGDICMGVATPATPAPSLGRGYSLAYIAATAGTYTNLGNLTVEAGEVAILRRYTNALDQMLWEKVSLGIYLKPTDVVDALNSTSTDKPLSAKQGKVLKDLIDAGFVYGGTIEAQASRIPVRKTFYLATSPGTIHDQQVANNEVAFIKYDGSAWSKDSLGILATAAELRAAVELLATAIDNKYTKPAGGIPQSDMTEEVQKSLDKADSAIQESDLKERLADYAKTDGYYETLGAGTADNLRGQSAVSEPVLSRMTGGGTELANGAASLEEIKGNSVPWNQQVPDINVNNWTKGGNNVTSLTFNDDVITFETLDSGTNRDVRPINFISFITGHRYYSSFNAKADAATSTALIYFAGAGVTKPLADIVNTIGLNWQKYSYIDTCVNTVSCTPKFTNIDSRAATINFKDYVLIDLTLMFGAGNEPTTVSQFESWLENNVGLKSYYPYNEGKLINAKPQNLISTGRNLLNPATGEAHLLTYDWEDNSNTYEIIGTYTALSFTDVNGVTTTPAPDANGKFVIDADGVLTVTAADLSQVCVQAVWDEAHDGEFVAFREDILNIDVTKIYGQLNGTGEYVQVFPNGMKKADYAGTVRDMLYVDNGIIKAVVNVGDVDLGDLTWLISKNGFVSSETIDSKNITSSILQYNATCARYNIGTPRQWYNQEIDKMIAVLGSGYGNNRSVGVQDSSYTDATTFKAAMDGVMLNYELATPLTYTNIVYREDGVDIPLELPMQYLADNWGTERVIVQEAGTGETEPVSCAPILGILYAMDAVEEIDTLKTNGVMMSDLKGNIDTLLVALNQALAGIGTITVGETATDKVFSFTFTPAAPEPEPTNE